MENQHRHIKGYSELNENDIALMNEIKELGARIQEVSGKVRAHIDQQYVECREDLGTGDEALEAKAKNEMERLLAADPYKWLNWGTDSMQSALMYMTRAVAQPTSF